MAMQLGVVVAPEKIPRYNHHQNQMDEREGFSMWLRGEFAAANSIIDTLCHHLQAVGEPGEYDRAIGCIQQRRYNWNAVLHMQQYFSVADVIYALQQVEWRRQQRAMGYVGVARKEYRRGGRGQRGGAEAQSLGSQVNGKDLNVSVKNKTNVSEKVREDEDPGEGGDKGKSEEEENKELDEKSEVASSIKSQGSTEGAVTQVEDKAHGSSSEGSCSVDEAGLLQKLQEKHNLKITPKTFVATETCDGESVNVVDGMKLYEDLFDVSEVSKLITLVNDLRAAGRRGQLQDQTFVMSKRPMKGHGREMIQLGAPIADAPREEETAGGTSKDLTTEPIPALLHDVIEHLLKEKVVNIKPDSCVIDIFNEGDHSQPHIWPQWFGRPVCVLFLTVCDMSFGKVMAVDHPGDYRGSLKLSLSPGSILVMQGRSADFARHAIPSLRKQRILVTFTKSQPIKYTSSDIHRFPSAAALPSHWVPPPSRSPNHIRPVAAKHFGPVPTAGVSHPPTAHPRLPPPNGVQPIYVPTPVAAAIAFPAPVALSPASVGWPAAPPRHPPPRLPAPGTGVFLPPQGSGSALNQPMLTPATENSIMETSSLSEKDCGLGRSNDMSTSPKVDGKVPREECHGSIDGKNRETILTRQEQNQNLDSAKSTGAV